MWWKKNKWRVIVPVAIAAILAFAFWYGGSAPGSRGWNPSPAAAEGAETEIVTQAPENTEPSLDEDGSEALPEASDAPSAPQETLIPEEVTAETPEPTPEQSTQPAEDTPAATPEQSEQPAEDVPASAEPSSQSAMEIDPETGKDKYSTDPVPEGKPIPVEPQDVTIGTTAYTCTISISCATILDNMDLCDPDKVELVPEDGWILEPTPVTFYEGESVFNVLQRTCKQKGIHMEYENTPIYNSAYIEGIQNLYEFDVGELSGWMYKVNDWFPNYGCSRYQLQDGDVICWVYTCDYGNDVGGGDAAGG